jgi:hypothetical protein
MPHDHHLAYAQIADSGKALILDKVLLAPAYRLHSAP